MDKILKDAAKRVKPTEKEQRETGLFLQKIIRAVNSVIRPLDLSLVLAGSFVRDTWLPHRKEFDVFILFPESTSREELEKEGIEAGKGIVNKLGGSHKIAYAEHPYVRARVDGYDIDIVPCFNVQSATKIKSAVDRTPFHNRWLNRNLRPGLTTDVRLMKQFCKAMGLYGSDTKTLGFSGYLCELLVIYYKSFRKLVREASKWEAGDVLINLSKSMPGDSKRFEGQPLVVIDPVDPNRNVAAALSPENFTGFVYACREFVKRPSIRFFFRPARKVNVRVLQGIMKNRRTSLMAVGFKRPDVIDDVLWPQLRRTLRRLKDVLEDAEFQVIGSGVFANKECLMLFELSVWDLPAARKITGPSIFLKKRSKQFINKYKPMGRLWVENSCWVAEIRRRFCLANEKLRDYMRGSCKQLRERGVSSYIAKSSGKGFRILSDKDVLRLARKDRELAEFLDRYFKRRFL
jgi:tRNA nucleotidyltransferase (CCA-adding enzyme)